MHEIIITVGAGTSKLAEGELELPIERKVISLLMKKFGLLLELLFDTCCS